MYNKLLNLIGDHMSIVYSYFTDWACVLLQ